MTDLPLTRTSGLTQARLKELLHYDPLTGKMTALVEAPNRPLGSDVGWLNGRGRYHVSIDGVTYPLSRLVWFYMKGEWPLGLVDHWNRNKADNRWENLRDATNAENGRNTNLSKRNTSGVKGVGWYKKLGRWYASIRVDRKLIHLGYFDDLEAAAAARRAAEIRYFDEFAPT